jgi:two-component system cell cycle response regulator
MIEKRGSKKMAHEKKSALPDDNRPNNADSSQSKRILIVDDDFGVRDSLDEFLQEHGFAVTALGSAKEALALIAGTNFDLIISDLVMPEMDGISMTKTIRQMGKDTPVLVMTGFASIEYAVESMKAGASDFVTKPLKFDHVIFIINRVLEADHIRRMAKEREYYKDLSNSDDLTKIGNYRYFNHVLQVEINRQRRYKRPLTLMIMDIDDFKRCNDRHGHLSGDMILAKIASLLTAEIRACDFAARYGGDEFTVILPEISEKEALAVAKRIMHSIGQYNFQSIATAEIGGISVTIGIASFPKDASEGRELISKADQAMYAGKNAGKGCICVCGDESNFIRLRKSTPLGVKLEK